MDKKAIEKQVSVLLEKFNYHPEKDDYLDIVAFVRSLGFVVGNASLAEDEDGFLAMRPENDVNIIGVNESLSLEWKRFIIAHEFAHSVLHYEGQPVYLHRDHKKGRNSAENDADYFAAALLMPKDSFKRIHDELKAAGLSENALAMQLASTYKVTMPMASRRIDEVIGAA